MYAGADLLSPCLAKRNGRFPGYLPIKQTEVSELRTFRWALPRVKVSSQRSNPRNDHIKKAWISGEYRINDESLHMNNTVQ